MVCPECHKTLPDESVFCLHCGTRLVTVDRLTPTNGGGASRPATPTGPASSAGGPSVQPADASRRQPYVLALRFLSDERLRYRVARWVCDAAPALPLEEVQVGLERGDFSTFLALTAEEAETAHRHLVALGVHPAQMRLAPATPADMLAADRPAARRAEWTRWQKVVAVAMVAAILLLAVIVIMRILGGRGF